MTDTEPLPHPEDDPNVRHSIQQQEMEDLSLTMPVRQEHVAELQRRLDEAHEGRRSAERDTEIDYLTGLANRRALDKALTTAEHDPEVAVIYIDGNDFKRVNDELDEDTGDFVIKDSAKIIEEVAGQFGVGRVFRRGGDEIVILAPAGIADALLAQVEDTFAKRTYSSVHPGQEDHAVEISLTGAHAQTLLEATATAKLLKRHRKDTGELLRFRELNPALLAELQQRYQNGK